MIKTKIDPEILQYYLESERKLAARAERNRIRQPKIDKLVGDLYGHLTMKQWDNGKLCDSEALIWAGLCKTLAVKKSLYGTKQEFIDFANEHFK